MTEQDYRDYVIKELTEVRVELVSLVERVDAKFESLETHFETVLQIESGKTKGKYELLEQGLNGQSKRIDEKIESHGFRLHAVEACESKCDEKRHQIHERIDELEDGKIQDVILSVNTLSTYIKITWAILCCIGAATAWALVGNIL